MSWAGLSGARLAWPGIALAITFVDDLIAGPILAAIGALVGGYGGVVLGLSVFTTVVALLVASAALASRSLDPRVQARIDSAVESASRRRFIGQHVRRVGDEHLWSTALVSAMVSPVLAVLLARLIHPTQALWRTGVVAVLAYGVGFSLFYAGLGAGAGAAF
jgi:Kef-type K+ transport system membrane component KefB